MIPLNSYRGPIVVEVALDRPRRWTLTARDVHRLETQLQVRSGEKVGFTEWISKAASWTAEEIIEFIAAGFHRYEPDMTTDTIMDLCSPGDLLRLFPVLFQSIGLKSDDQEKKEPAQPEAIPNA
jgi:hypothetical protein